MEVANKKDGQTLPLSSRDNELYGRLIKDLEFPTQLIPEIESPTFYNNFRLSMT